MNSSRRHENMKNEIKKEKGLLSRFRLLAFSCLRVPLSRQRDEELDEELRSHLAMAVNDRIERGESPAHAREQVRREFGNVTLIKEITRDMWGWSWRERLAQDVRYGVRVMAGSRAVTAMIVLSLALGIGAFSTVFALINAIELRRLPV